MILHTIISPADIFYDPKNPPQAKNEVYYTDPYKYLDSDLWSKRNKSRRK